MRILALAAMLVVMGCAQGGGTAATTQISPTPASSPIASVSPTDAIPSASPPPPAPSVQCVQAVIPAFQAVVDTPSASVLYDVTDPLHPHVVCRIANTYVHILTGTSFEYLVPRADGTTDIVLHALGSNNESVAARMKADLYRAWSGGWESVAWSPSLDTMAYLANGGVNADGLGVTDIWMATATGRTKVYSYAVGGKDAFGRPGFPPPTLGLSADGAYLVAGWTIALSPVRVFRLSDMADVTPSPPPDFRFALWGKSGHTLYMVGGSSVVVWTPGSPPNTLPATPAWLLGPNFSPDGARVAFTAVTTTRAVTANVYDLGSRTDRQLSSQPRSSIVFVRAGWVWDLEEKTCVQSSTSGCFDPTAPDGKVLAMELASGRESAVSFAPGEAPFQPPTYAFLGPGDLWPSS